jgi:ribosomal protein L37AE/L43A
MANSLNVEERLLGMMAVEKGFISEKQLRKCLNIVEFSDGSTLESIFLRENYLSQAQLKELQKQLNFSSELEDKQPPQQQNRPQKTFGEIALEQYMIDHTQLDNALAEQAKYDERGLRIQLGQILQSLGYLTTAQVGRILQTQLKKLLYCKHCKSTKAIFDYHPGKIYQCDKCKLDLIEAKIQEKPKPKVKPKPEFFNEDLDDDHDDDDGGLGNLQILEL